MSNIENSKQEAGALSHLSVELGAFLKEQYSASFFKWLYNRMTTAGKLTIFLPFYFLCLFSFVLITPVAAILAPIIFWIERKLEQMPKLFYK
jgi:hypothetical protein